MSTSDILAALLFLLVLLRHSKADCRTAKDSSALIQDMVVAQSSPFFNASGSAMESLAFVGHSTRACKD